jgi:hypothetical protein
MTWPTTAIVTTDFDAGTDSAGNARAQILQMAQNVNDIKDGRNQANGVAPLDGSSLVPITNMPVLTAIKGGTGFSSFTVGDILIATSTTAFAKIPPGAVGHALVSNGAGILPTYQAVSMAIASQAEAEAGVENTKAMTALRTNQAILAQPTYVGKKKVIFTASGTWTPPDGITQAVVTVIGGGGGGAVAGATSAGSGGEIEAFVDGITGAVSITVGQGGTTSATGGTSSFGSYVTATGGVGGAGGADGTSSTTETALRQGSSGDVAFNTGASARSGTGLSGSRLAWTVSSSVKAGAGGNSGNGLAVNAVGGMDGIVIVEW